MKAPFTRRSCGLFLVWMLAGLLPCAALAQLLGPEFQVHSDTSYLHRDPVVASDGAGSFVAAWATGFQDGDSFGIFGQRFDAAGSAVGNEFQVNSYTSAEQAVTAIAADAAGRFIVVWQSLYQDGSLDGVFGQRFEASGAPLGNEFRVNSVTTASQVRPSVAADGSGNFVVVWQSPGDFPGFYDLFGQRFDATGAQAGAEFRVNTYTTSVQMGPAVARSSSGSFLVVWASHEQDGSQYGIYGQRYDAAGVPAGSEFRVNTYTVGDQSAPSAAIDGAGNFIVAWQGPGDGSNLGILGQRYDATGAALGGEFQINTETVNDQQSPKVAADAAGDFVVTWQSDLQDGSNWGVFAQRFRRSGTRIGGEFQVNSYTTERQYFPAIAATGSRNFVVTWKSFGQGGLPTGIFGRQVIAAILRDGFEAGDFCSWSAAVGGGTCP